MRLVLGCPGLPGQLLVALRRNRASLPSYHYPPVFLLLRLLLAPPIWLLTALLCRGQFFVASSICLFVVSIPDCLSTCFRGGSFSVC
eukprot:5098024-Amphidinium_carterae.1